MTLMGNAVGNWSSDSVCVTVRSVIRRKWWRSDEFARRRRRLGALAARAGVHVPARQRMGQAPVRKWLAREELPQRQPATVERMSRSREVNAPHAVLFLAHLGAGRVGVRFEPFAP